MATADANSNGIVNYATGKFTGAGAAVDVNLGFTPRMVRVINATDRLTDEKYAGMAAGEVIHTVAAGTRTLDTGGHIAFADPETDGFRGFSIIADVAINAKVLYWEAFG